MTRSLPLPNHRNTRTKIAVVVCIAIAAAGCASNVDQKPAKGTVAATISTTKSPNASSSTQPPTEREWPTAAKANEAIGRGVEIVSPCCDDGIQTIDGVIKFAKDAGFESIRYAVHLSTKQATSAPYEVDQAWLAKIDAELDLLLKNGFTVILVNNDNQGDRQRTGDRLVALWTQIGEYFKDRPSSVYFEIQNEPTWYDQNNPLSNFLTAEELNPLLARVIPVIRKSNPKRIIVIDGPLLATPQLVPTIELPAGDGHLIVDFHNYFPLDFTGATGGFVPGTRWTGTDEQVAAMKATMNDAVCWSRRNGVPMFIGEFAVTQKAVPSDRVAWIKSMTRLAEAENISWTYFTTQDSGDPTDGFPVGLWNEAAGTQDQLIIDALLHDPSPPLRSWATCK